MRSGNLRQSISVQRQTTEQGSSGQLVDTWVEIAVRRCSIEPLNGREYFVASGEHSEINVRIRMRYDQTVKTIRAFDRLVDNSESPNTIYNIETVINPRERNRELVLMCKRD